MERLILDTDIGTDIDDAYALAFILGCPEFDLVGVTTAYGPTARRANLARALLDLAGRPEVPVFVGLSGQGDIQERSGQLDWGDSHATRPQRDEDAVDWLIQTINAAPGQVSLLAIGPLTNIGAALTRDPSIAAKVKRVAFMAGSVRKGYNGQPPAIPEYNIKCDISAAQAVFTAAWQPLVAPLDVTMLMNLDAAHRARITKEGGALGQALAELYARWWPQDPILHDPLAAGLMLRPDLATIEPLRLVVEADGLTREAPGTPNSRAALAANREGFIEFYTDRVCGKR